MCVFIATLENVRRAMTGGGKSQATTARACVPWWLYSAFVRLADLTTSCEQFFWKIGPDTTRQNTFGNKFSNIHCLKARLVPFDALILTSKEHLLEWNVLRRAGWGFYSFMLRVAAL